MTQSSHRLTLAAAVCLEQRTMAPATGNVQGSQPFVDCPAKENYFAQVYTPLQGDCIQLFMEKYKSPAWDCAEVCLILRTPLRIESLSTGPASPASFPSQGHSLIGVQLTSTPQSLLPKGPDLQWSCCTVLLHLADSY